MKIRDLVKINLEESFPDYNITTIYGDYWIRFELGGEVENGTHERIDKVVKRATEIFNQTISDDELLLVVEDYSDDYCDKDRINKSHLYSLFDESKIQRFHGPFEQIYYEEDVNGDKKECVFDEPLECDLIIGKFCKSEIDSVGIIKGIANLEMGFENSIPQNVTFFSPKSTNGFHMYDDRGCDIWSNDKERLRSIYNNLYDWILDYNRNEIDDIFK